MPFDVEKFLAKVKDLLNKKASIVIAVSEGIKLADGRYVCELGSVGDYVDAFGHKQSSGNSHLPGETLQRSADARQELLNFPHYREALPIWHPEWILMKHSW